MEALTAVVSEAFGFVAARPGLVVGDAGGVAGSVVGVGVVLDRDAGVDEGLLAEQAPVVVPGGQQF